MRCATTSERFKFQSRNRESYLFKFKGTRPVQITDIKFQSRNRESYLFKFRDAETGATLHTSSLFQSRNRESYLFKKMPRNDTILPVSRFQSRNRESYLFKPYLPEHWGHDARLKFQSRNRESYLFKWIKRKPSRWHTSLCFNLVIENLIFSRRISATTS